MRKWLGILVLVVAVATTGATACPGGVLACTFAKTAKHSCCGGPVPLLKASDCCGGGARVPQAPLTPGLSAYDGYAAQILATPIVPLTAFAATVCLTPASRAILHYGPAPPDSPVLEHTLLLL